MSDFIPRFQKRCPNCNKLFGLKQFPNGKQEPPSHFKKKIHCSRICGAIAAANSKKLAIDAEQRA